MLYNSISQRNITADLWEWRLGADTTGAGGIEREYFYSEVITFFGGLRYGSGLYIYTEKPLQQFARILNLRGIDGESIMPDGAQYEVRTVQPSMTPWGTVEQYRHDLVKA